MRLLVRVVVRLVACFMILSLTSCNTYKQYVQHEQTLKACKQVCSQRLQRCEHSCRNNCQNCRAVAMTEAALHFNQYKKQQCLQGEIVALQLQSFRDPLECRKVTCACTPDFDVCVQSCKGRIHKRLRGVAPC
ncbi:MAG: acyltransferase [Legionellaceae bacterium]|nr:acyltransferase [Legionellaceae bacterium]